jgi:hypothetical protein
MYSLALIIFVVSEKKAFEHLDKIQDKMISDDMFLFLQFCGYIDEVLDLQPKAKFRKISIYSNKFFHNFDLFPGYGQVG